MAFDRKSLKALAGMSARQSPQLWGYQTNDDNAAVIAANYLDELVDTNDASRNILQPGHIIFAHVDMDGTPAFHIYRVTASSTSEITIVSGDQL